MAETVDTVVIGAGVVGLAVARQLALSGREVLVLERNSSFGEETSARNSEVIHAGIYYPQGSLKAQSCVRGKMLLYRYCKERGVAHKRCGKVIVATNAAQVANLHAYADAAQANGVADLQMLDADQAQALEPQIAAYAGLLSPSTGIVDSHAYMLALLGDLEAAQGVVVYNSPVLGIGAHPGGVTLQTKDLELNAKWVVNSAGLHAVELADTATNIHPNAYYAVGHYYAYSGHAPVSRLVYPVAQPGGLGVHITLDLGGAAKFGPDVRWQQRLDYAFDDSQRSAFVSAIQAYYPDVDTDRLQPGYTGIRPKISGPDEPAADFRIDGPLQHGIVGLVNLFGIESPGLTASLALAELVQRTLSD